MRNISLSQDTNLDLSELRATILSPGQVTACRSVENVLQEAREIAAQLKSDAKTKHESTLKSARKMGFDAGLSDARAQISALRDALEALKRKREQDVLELTFSILQRLFGDWSQAKKLEGTLHQTLVELGPSSVTEITLNPKSEGQVQEILPEGAVIEFDPNLPEDCARLTTELGMITVSLDRQLKIIRDFLEAQIHDDQRFDP